MSLKRYPLVIERTGTGAGAAAGVANGAVANGSSGTASLSSPVDIPKRALSDFDRAVGLMKAGNSGEAELEFKTLAAGYPQLAGAQINRDLNMRLQYLAGWNVNWNRPDAIFLSMMGQRQFPKDLFVGSAAMVEELRKKLDAQVPK